MSESAEQLLELARREREGGRFVEAERVYLRYTAERPEDAGGWNELGIVLAQGGKYERAAAAFRRAIQLSPDMLGAYHNLAMALERKKDYAESEAVSRAALRIDSNSVETLNVLGGALAFQDKFAEAALCFEAAVALQPKSVGLRFRLGKALYLAGELERGIAELELALRAEPENLGTRYELAMAYRNGLRLSESLAMLEEVLAKAPEHIEARGTRAMVLLMDGQLREGWKEYEHRWGSKTFPDRKRDYRQPAWSGEALAGRTILIYGEQGAGDFFHFIRYAPLLARRGAKVIVECPSDLIPAVKTVQGVSEIIIKGSKLPDFDFHCALMSLPLAFDTTLETIPATVPYITAQAQYTQEWVERLAPLAGQFKVGLAWSGSPKHSNDKRRSVPLSTFAPLAAVGGATFVSLQKGPGVAQAASPPGGMKLLNFAGGISHFGDTAALIEGLDLVIAVDTAVVHLAGAMGKPVWVLLPYSPDWRWMLKREDSPWYPTMRLFRQERYGDWEGVVSRIAGELKGAIAGGIQGRG